MTTPPVSLSSIGQIAINVHDLERATVFYRDTLDISQLFTAGGMAFLDCDGVRLMLGIAEKPEFDHPSPILYFNVEDARTAYESLKEGVEFRSEPLVVHRTETYELWMAFFHDTEGNTLALMSEIVVQP